MSDSAARAIGEHFQIPQARLAILARKLPECMGCEGGVDSDGLFVWQHTKPDGMWDWYVIGGRWDGIIHGRRTEHDPYDGNRAIENTVAVEELLKSPLKKRLPYGLLIPTGEWLAGENFVFGPDGIQDRRDPKWGRQVRRTLRAFPVHRVVCIDIHQ